MPVIGITGGIATGKSSFARALVRQLPAVFFDADAFVHELLRDSPAVRESVREKLPDASIEGESPLDRGKLRNLIFSDPSKRQVLESILHPRVRERWMSMAQESAAAGRWFCAEIPLLFETDAQAHFDRVIVVGCSPETQRHRLREARGIDDDLAGKIIAAQLDLCAKMAKADHLIWNDSTEAAMEGQAALLAASLHQTYG